MLSDFPVVLSPKTDTDSNNHYLYHFTFFYISNYFTHSFHFISLGYWRDWTEYLQNQRPVKQNWGKK